MHIFNINRNDCQEVNDYEIKTKTTSLELSNIWNRFKHGITCSCWNALRVEVAPNWDRIAEDLHNRTSFAVSQWIQCIGD